MYAAYFILPALALASPAIVKRDAASIDQSISYIQGNITALNNTLNTFTKPKDAITAFQIEIEAENLIKSVNNSAQVAKASAPLSDSESNMVATAVLNLQPNINSVIDNIENHKPQFDTALFGFSASPIVKMDLQNSKAAADDFGKQLTPKLSGAYQQAAPIIIQQIDAKFDEAIAKFSS